MALDLVSVGFVLSHLILRQTPILILLRVLSYEAQGNWLLSMSKYYELDRLLLYPEPL